MNTSNAYLQLVIDSIVQSERTLFRYITANDVGSTGGHQAGFYVPKGAYSVLFDTPGGKGENKDKSEVEIVWHHEDGGRFTTKSRFIYYGRGSRNEYRITRFGRDFPFLTEEYTGSMLILVKRQATIYLGYVLSSDEDIDYFLEYFSISPTSTESIIMPHAQSIIRVSKEQKLLEHFLEYYQTFPDTKTMAFWGQKYVLFCNHVTRQQILRTPDQSLLLWIDTEYKLYQALEEKLYAPIYSKPFASLTELIDFANTILNRRKSRAGKSLEHHLARVFHVHKLAYSSQARTEGNKRPDFILPSEEAYHNNLYPQDKLFFLGAKTTCKDRWRQILNEADRIPHKHLFTLQKGISRSQIEEMKKANVTLVVPQNHISSFDVKVRDLLMTLKDFMLYVSKAQSTISKIY